MSERTYNIILVILIAVACVVTGALLYLIYSSTLPPEPTPTPVPTTPPQSTDAWFRIQSAGKIVAGTSADYPPFAFWTDDYRLDGLDVALIDEIGTVLGLDVEIKDMAFDGLNWALELQQIDVAIAALSVTPERTAELDFTDIYYVSEDAILARTDASIPPITNVTQLSIYRIGVQRATVYSNWIHESLIDTGLMPASQLHEYEEIEQAVRDVREGRIDVVVLDFPVAQVATSQGGVKLVGQGLNLQYYGIAVPKGEVALKDQLNRALRQLNESGRLAELTLQYTGSVSPLPTPTPTSEAPQVTETPVATTTPAPCVDGMRYVLDLNLDDNNMTSPPIVQPGTAFRKGWRIQNTGTCTWDRNYQLTYDGGNSPASSMSGLPTPINGTVPPGAQYDMWVDLISPSTPGVYQGFWVLRNGQDQKFGSRVWVGITVPSPATMTPPPTQTPSPGIAFTVDRNQIFAGECVIFNWNVTGAQAVYFYAQGQPWQQNQVPPVGTNQQCPTQTTNYELRVAKPDGTAETRQITVFVNQRPGAPIIVRFEVVPGDQIQAGQCVDIRWEVTGNVNLVNIFRNTTSLWADAPISGTTQDCPPGTGQVTYIIEANGPGGQSRLQRTINVVVAPPVFTSTPSPSPSPSATQQTQTPTSTPITPPPPAPPVIFSFLALPAQINSGECVTVTWQVGGQTSQIELLRNDVVVNPNAGASGAIEDCGLTGGTYTYRLEVLGLNGQTISNEQVVTVASAPSSPPLVGTKWVLEEMAGELAQPLDLIPGIEVSANFSPENQLSGFAGCNDYSAVYTVDQSTLLINTVTSTKLPCDELISAQETTYLAALERSATYVIAASNLTVFDSNGIEILKYVADGISP